jgi:hypothetical protein
MNTMNELPGEALVLNHNARHQRSHNRTDSLSKNPHQEQKVIDKNRSCHR